MQFARLESGNDPISPNRPSRSPWSKLLLFVLVAHNLGAAQISDAIKSSIQRRVDYGYNPSVVIGIVDQGGRDFYGYGSTTLEAQQTPDEHTFYEIGSVTKVFTTSLLAEMVDRGDITLDDAVESHLPEGVNVPTRSGVEISLFDLATHHSGLPNNPPQFIENDPLNPFSPFSTDDLNEILDTDLLTHTPGTHFEYSNLGLGLLGFALGETLGLSYGDALRDRILTPLGLEDTDVALSPEQSSRRAEGYQGVLPRAPFEIETLDGAGVLLSTVSDMLTFLEHQLELKDSSLNAVFQETHRSRRSMGTPGQNIGLGWLIIQLGADTVTMHDGATLGHNAFAGFNPRTKTGVVVFSNARINQYAGIQDLGLKALVPAFPLASIRRPASLSTEELRRLPGQYRGPNDTAFNFRIVNGRLVVSFLENRGAEFTLYPVNATRFQLYEATVEATAFFGTDDEGRIDSMQWRQNGETTEFSRVRQSPRLELGVSENTFTIQLSGEADRLYTIETSHDLREWTLLSERSVWDPPLEIGNESTASGQFFRVQP